jgi:uroporphyrinogen-III synthase
MNDSQPLTGWRVLVTRAAAQAGELTRHLVDRGASVVELPAIEVVAADPEPLDRAIADLSNYDWVLFTSVNGVAAFCDRLAMRDPSYQSMVERRIGVIGRGTERALLEHGIRVDFVPSQFVAESVLEGLLARGVIGQRILLPRAEIARDTLPDGLRAAGATVDVVVAYRTQVPDAVASDALALVRDGAIDIATFASPSSVRNLIDIMGGGVPDSTAIVSIGPITSAALTDCGMRVDAQAVEFSIPGLVEAVTDFAVTHPKRIPVI